jgi:hypothetical protein
MGFVIHKTILANLQPVPFLPCLLFASVTSCCRLMLRALRTVPHKSDLAAIDQELVSS